MKRNLHLQKLFVLFVFIFSICDTFAWKPIMIGHRGCRQGVENTEAAFLNAVKNYGFQALECDVKVTSDNKYVCWHDDIITKCSPNCTIYTNTLATIQSKTLTQTRSGVTYTGKICTVDRYLEICRDYNVIPIIELKWASGINNNDMSNFAGLYSLIQKYGLVDKAVILTSMQNSILHVRQNYPKLRCQYLVNYLSSSNISWCKTNGCDISSCYYYSSSNYVTQSLVTQAKNAGLRVSLWTVNSSSDYKTYASYGANFVTSDDLKLKDIADLSGTDPNISTSKTTIYYRPSTTKFAKGYTNQSTEGKEGGWGDVYWAKNSRMSASVHGPYKANIYLDYSKTKDNSQLASSRFIAIDVPSGYTGVIAYRLNATSATQSNYNLWKYASAGATLENTNTVPKFTNSAKIPTPETIPTNGKNLLCNKEGWWDVWYWAYYLPKTNNVTMYFANTGDWKDVQLLTGKDIYTHATTPTTATIPGTKLTYFNLNNKEYGYTHYGFIGNGANWDNSKTIPVTGGSESEWVYDESSKFANNKTSAAKNSKSNQNRIANRIKYATNRTGLLENLLSGANVFTPGSSNDAALTKKTISSYSNLNYTQTVVAEAGGKVACSTYKLTGANTSAAVTTSAATGTSSIVAAYTATTILTAYPDAGYSVEGWYEGNYMVCTGPVFKYTTPDKARTITVKFMKGARKDVRAQTYVYDQEKGKYVWKDSNEGGTFTMKHSGDQVYVHDTVGYVRDITMTIDPITFEATANSDYEFIGWWNNSMGVFTANPWTMENPANYDESVTARFAKFRSDLNVAVERGNGGKIALNYDNGLGQRTDTLTSLSTKLLIGSSLSFTAMPDEGCQFLGWYENNTLLSTDLVYTSTASSETRSIYARFTFTVKKDVRAQTYVYDSETGKYVWKDSNEGGVFTIKHSDGQVYRHEVVGYVRGLVVTSDPVTFTAIPNTGYELIGWWNNPTVYTDDPWVMERPEEYRLSVTARFAKTRSEMNASVDNEAGGVMHVTYDNGYGEKTDTLTSLSTKLLIGSVVNLEAVASHLSTFLGWYENETLLIEETTYTFTTTDTHRNIVAKFKTDSTTTDLNDVDASKDVYKVVVNGQVYVYKQGKLYTILGVVL